jgi:two-component system sensor histidine kinase RegB
VTAPAAVGAAFDDASRARAAAIGGAVRPRWVALGGLAAIALTVGAGLGVPHPAVRLLPPIAAMAVIWFVASTTRALARRERELAALRAAAARDRRLASLTMLAAGAAHELATPLATIAVVARDLERAAADGGGAADLLADARLLRAEITRCHRLLDRMRGRASGPAVGTPGALDLRGVLGRVRDRLSPEQAGRLEARCEAVSGPARLPEETLVGVLVNLTRNAFEASPATSKVSLSAVERGGALRFVVRDQGDGMAPEVSARAGEPFFTTKGSRGFGLGLFLARRFAEEYGGALALDSIEGAGTTATLELPARRHDRS